MKGIVSKGIIGIIFALIIGSIAIYLYPENFSEEMEKGYLASSITEKDAENESGEKQDIGGSRNLLDDNPSNDAHDVATIIGRSPQRKGNKGPKTIEENINSLRQLLRNADQNKPKIMSLAHKMSQGTAKERRVALDAFKAIGGKDAAREIIKNYFDGDSWNSSVGSNFGDFVNYGGGYGNGGSGSGTDNSNDSEEGIKEAAIDTLKHVIEESLFTGESVMDKPSWLAVLDEMDYVTRYSYLVLLAQFDKSESVPIFLEMYDSNDVDLQALSRLFVSMLANGRDMSDKENATEWLESFAVKEEEDDKVKAD